MEERYYLQQLCAEILSIDKNIRFAGVIENKGILIVGKYRGDIESPHIKSSPLVIERSTQEEEKEDGSKDDNNSRNRSRLDSQHELSQKSSPFPISSFQASRMAFDLNRKFENSLGTLNFQLSSFAKITLVTIALTNRNDRLLCISIDPVPNSFDIVSKMLKAL